MVAIGISPETHASHILRDHSIAMFDSPISSTEVVVASIISGRIDKSEAHEPFVTIAAQKVGEFMVSLSFAEAPKSPQFINMTANVESDQPFRFARL